MPWLIAIGVLVLLVLTPMVVGRFLPKDYHGRVTVTFERAPDEVFTALMDHHATPVTGGQHKGTTDLEDVDGLPAWVEEMTGTQITVHTRVAESPTRLVRHYEDAVVPMVADVELVLEATATGTRVKGTNHFVVSDGTWHVPLFRFILTVTGGADRSLKEYFGGIGRALGERPKLE